MKTKEIAEILNTTPQNIWMSAKKNTSTKPYFRICRILTKSQMRYFLNDSNFKGVNPLNKQEAVSILKQGNNNGDDKIN